jgi:hypothetical protein
VTNTFTLLSWGFAASAFLVVGMALALWDGSCPQRLLGSVCLKASGCVLALFGWGVYFSGGRESAPSAAAGFTVVAAYAVLMACVEICLAAKLGREENDGARRSAATPVHRARDFVKRYPEKMPFDSVPPLLQQSVSEQPSQPAPVRSAAPPSPSERGLVGNDVIPRDLFGTQADSLRREMESRGGPNPGGNHP